MKKGVALFVVILMLCINISYATASVNLAAKSDNLNNESKEVVVQQQPDKSTIELLQETVTKYLNMNKSLYTQGKQTQGSQSSPQPLLGGNDPLGLWINVVYNGQSFQKQVQITPQMIRGKLTDPNYRTPIKFDVDGDSLAEVEVGFGFFKSGIDEKMPDGSTVNHPAWEIALDFSQVGDYLTDQKAGLEVWEELHVNLNVINSKSVAHDLIHDFANSRLGIILKNLINKITQKGTHFPLLQKLIEKLRNRFLGGNIGDEPKGNIGTPGASEDYIVARVGFRSPAGQKIPLSFEKTFAIAKENIFRPAIFQHEMDPKDVIGTAAIDVMFGFQAFKQGMPDPTYNIEFSIDFNPACYVVTQLTPLSGKVFYYYHSASNEPTDITFSSNLLKGGDVSEEENSTFSLTISLASVPNELLGQYMCFDLNMVGDSDPLGGSFVYYASSKFSVGMTLSSPWFKEKMAVKGVPTSAKFEWDLDASFDVVQDQLLFVQTTGYVSLTMNSNLQEIAIYYPKADPTTKDVTWLSVKSIPSSRRLEAGASLDINNASMLQINANSYFEHSMSSSIGDITIYYPKPDPDTDPDMVFFQIPSGSFASSGRVSAEGEIYVDPNPDNFWTNPNNYFYAKVDRSADSDFGQANFYLPNVPIPLLQVQNVPGNAYGLGEFWWNQLKGHIHAQRSSSSGNQDPIKLNLVFDNLLVSNQLSLGNGHIDMAGKIANDGYFNFDTENDMVGNVFNISNLASGNSLSIDAGTISADNFETDWNINSSGPQLKVDDLAMSGNLKFFDNFEVGIALNGKNGQFTGTWATGESGGFQIDFNQDEPTQLDFNLSQISDNFVFDGYVIISQDIHFDVSWNWIQGSDYTHPGYFMINDNTNDANILAIELNATYKNRFGADVEITNASLYFNCKWYKDPNHWLPIVNLEYYVGGQIDHLNLLWEYQWYPII